MWLQRGFSLMSYLPDCSSQAKVCKLGFTLESCKNQCHFSKIVVKNVKIWIWIWSVTRGTTRPGYSLMSHPALLLLKPGGSILGKEKTIRYKWDSYIKIFRIVCKQLLCWHYQETELKQAYKHRACPLTDNQNLSMLIFYFWMKHVHGLGTILNLRPDYFKYKGNKSFNSIPRR